jgi:hypothetical protein
VVPLDIAQCLRMITATPAKGGEESYRQLSNRWLTR